MDLSYDIHENIFRRLDNKDILNYSQTDKESMNICDTYIRWKARRENIPLNLLPENNVTSSYIRLHQHMEWMKKGTYHNKIVAFTEEIDRKNLDVVIWLNFLLLEKGSLDDNLNIMGESFLYAFYNNNKLIGGWLFSRYYEIIRESYSCGTKKRIKCCKGYIHIYHFINKEDQSFSSVGGDYYLDELIDYTLNHNRDRNRKEIIHYILDEFSDKISHIKKRILILCAINNDVKILRKLINKYDINIKELNGVMLSTYDVKIIKFLLKYWKNKHPNEELNSIITNYIKTYPKKNIMKIISEYGHDYEYNHYKEIFNEIIDQIRNYSSIIKCDDLDWFLSKYGDNIDVDYIRYESKNNYNKQIRNVLSWHLRGYGDDR